MPAIHDNDTILQPETRPISQEQPVAEVNGIYAGPIMDEANPDNQSNIRQMGSGDNDAGVQALGQAFEGIVDRPVTANDFNNPNAFDNMGAQFPGPGYPNVNFAWYAGPRVAYENPAYNPYAVAGFDEYRNQDIQSRLGQWVYENRDEERTVRTFLARCLIDN
jgi:hypothetical protein